jgi:hypothetical protein
MIILLNRIFSVGFALGLFIFAALNVYSAFRGLSRGFTKLCFDCYETYGFPFAMHESGTILHLDEFIWSGVVANMAVAVAASILLGGLVSYLARFAAIRKIK